MSKLRDALETVIRLLKAGPLGNGSPIPLRPKYDDHVLATTGNDEPRHTFVNQESLDWAKAHAPKFRQPPKRVA